MDWMVLNDKNWSAVESVFKLKALACYNASIEESLSNI